MARVKRVSPAGEVFHVLNRRDSRLKRCRRYFVPDSFSPSRGIKTERYNTTGPWPCGSSSSSSSSSGSGIGNLIARSETKFDDRGRVYQTIRYAVNVATGIVGNALT